MEKEEQKPEAEASLTNNKNFWIIGSIIMVLFGLFTAKIFLFPTENYKVALVDGPKETKAGSVITYTWRIDGPPTSIYHTGVYLGKESTPGELAGDIHPADTKYTESVKDFMYGKFNIPLQFVGNVNMDTPGKYYLRVHATIKDKNYWSDEEILDVK